MRSLPRRIAALALALCCVAAIIPLTAAPAAAATPELIVDGRGWGHGRGMSQYGAFGYVRDFGRSKSWVLNHYYGGTHAGLASAAAEQPVNASKVRVRLMAMDQAESITVGVPDAASVSLSASSGVSIPSSAGAVQLRRSGASWKVYTGPGCGGPWTSRGTGSGKVTVHRSGPGQLRLCRPGGYKTWYPGSIRGFTDGSVHRTINVADAEAYLKGVVPREMPPSWALKALRVQAVSARSYLLAGDTRHRVGTTTYADTCDTTTCQVYGGFYQQLPGGSKTRMTWDRTDQAVNDTAGEVRLFDSNNRIARTEFSSTSGGWTAGGVFPPVKDEGDVISPRHTWSRTVSAAPLQSAYGGGSTLTDIDVTERNGLGAMGGRALTVRLRFSNGTTEYVSGNAIRSVLGLYSNWFSVRIDQSDADAYIGAVFNLFLQRDPSSADLSRWRSTVNAGNYIALTNELSVSQEWAGVEIRNLYRKILGREADSSGLAYWLDRVRAGYHIEQIATFFYGGPEYFRRAGSTNSGFVDRLYRDLLGRAPDSGKKYWVGKLNSGELDRTGVAANFYLSIESRLQRVDRLYNKILGRDPDKSGRRYWADELPKIGDVKLAAYLASSHEYYRRVTS